MMGLAAMASTAQAAVTPSPVRTSMGAWVNQNLYPQAFYQGFDGNIWGFGNNGTSWSFANHNTPTGVSVAYYVGKVVKDNTNPIVFVKGSDGNLWREAYAGGSTWNWGNNGTPAGVDIAAPMGAVNNNTSYPLAFILGSDGNLWHDGYNGSTWNWANHGTPTGVQLKASMGVVSNNGNTPMVFVLGSDGNLWRNVNVGSGWSWANMGIPATGVSIVSSMGAIVNNDSYPIVFVLGSDGNLWRDGYNGSTWTWANMGSPNALGITASMGAVVVNHAYPEVFVVGGDGNLWRNSYNGTSWNWFNTGTPGTTGIGASLGAVVNNTLYPIVFVMGDDSNLWTCGWNGSKWTWTNQSNLTVTPGTLNLKYQILGADYAPPGQQSSVTYLNSTSRGTSTDNSETFAKTTSVNTTTTVGSQSNDLLQGSTSYTQQTSSFESISLNQIQGGGVQLFGPANSALGIDHDADVIWLWLNPQILLTVTGPNSVRWSGYSFNAADPAYPNGMDEYPLFVADIKAYILGQKPIPDALLRRWDSAGLGALTTGDLITILAADPLASLYGTSSNFNPNTDTSGRFDLQAGHNFPYVPAAQNTQPLAIPYSFQVQSTTVNGQLAQHAYSVSSLVGSSGTDTSFASEISSQTAILNTYQVVDGWSRSASAGTTSTASFTIVGPAYTDNYTGPQQVQVWRDNVYGSFMFFYSP